MEEKKTALEYLHKFSPEATTSMMSIKGCTRYIGDGDQPGERYDATLIS